MTAIALSPSQRRALRAEAHALQPVVLVGQDGLSDAVLKETDAALGAHGLIKVRVFSDDRQGREATFAALADRLGAAPVQHIGKLLVLWRPITEKVAEPREGRQPGPRVVKVVSYSTSGTHRATVKRVTVLGNERLTRGGKVKRRQARQTSVKKRSLGQT
jgi:putative YhbY family RNA-binding protein